jgi:hypothetical protein
MTVLFAAVHESEVGPFRKCAGARMMSVVEGGPEDG